VDYGDPNRRPEKYEGLDRREGGQPYTGPERRADPSDHSVVRIIREEIAYQTRAQNQFLEQKFANLEDGQRGLRESHILLRGKQEEFQREIDGWKAGAKWVNIAAIILAGAIGLALKMWDWAEKHVK
jgi:hypothetical protein